MLFLRGKEKSMILVVAEKPSAGRDIARVLGVDNKKQGYIEDLPSFFIVFSYYLAGFYHV